MRHILLHIVLVIQFIGHSYAQESIFSAFKSDLKKADELYESSAYFEAITLYKSQLDKNNLRIPKTDIISKIASSYYHLNDMPEAVHWYQEFLKHDSKMRPDELLKFASALQGTGDYKTAIDWMQKYLTLNPENLEVSRKIWQLQNISYLYEDSAFFDLKVLPFNTGSDECNPTLYNNTIVFASNRPDYSIVNHLDATTQQPFFTWYKVNFTNDTSGLTHYDEPNGFASNIKAKYHKGRVSFNESADLMAFTRTSEERGKNGYTSKLFFAKRTESGQWQEVMAFPYNSNSYSILHPSFANGGNTIYFASDMQGNLGDTDLYYSNFTNGEWTQPVNLGPEINTPQKEGHPYFYKGELYFSSNGHPGLGGLDIHKVNLSNKPLEVVNPGYPMNTHFDDFGLVLDSTGLSGVLVSNRSDNDRLCDNIYEIRIAERTFPLTVEGKISYKRNELSGSPAEMVVLANAKLELIDKENQNVIEESITDQNGNFKIDIPYDSQYLLKVNNDEFGTAVVSMDIPRNYQNHLTHDIVIMEDLFK